MKLYRASQIVILASALAFAVSAGARTWTVEQDGSGDWLTLQPAADAAADGDTILIGPGRYDQFHATPWWYVAIVYLDVPKTLSFIGVGTDEVIVGGSEFSDDRMGMAFSDNGPHHLKNITFENVLHGVARLAGGTVDSCRFVGCTNGINFTTSDANVVVTNCVFEGREYGNSQGESVNARRLPNVLIENCVSKDMGIYVQDIENYEIRNCQFPRTIGGTAVNSVDSNGLIENCDFWGKVGNQGGMLTFRDCEMSGPPAYNRSNLACEGGQTVIEGCVLNGSSGVDSTIYIQGSAQLSGSGNHIFKGESSTYSIYMFQTSGPDRDLRNNYWGTSDPQQISDWILDGNDGPEVNVNVLFEPFSSDPLPVEGPEKSFGGLKAMFR